MSTLRYTSCRPLHDALLFGELRIAANATHHVFAAGLDLPGLEPNALRVELYAD